MTTLLKENKLFYILSLLFWLACLVVLLSTEKGEFLQVLNVYHQPFWDHFFYYATYLGDGLIAAVLLATTLLFFNMRKALVITFTFLTVVLVVQLLKNIVFHGEPRPSVFFNGVEGLYYIPWLEVHGYGSFPSGHTAQAFCLALCFLFYDTQKRVTPVLFTLAFLTGLSRLYLMQHFPLDVFAGSVIGVWISTFVFPFLENRPNILHRPVLNQSLFSYLKKK